MNENVVEEIVCSMAALLDCGQLKYLRDVLQAKLAIAVEAKAPNVSNEDLLQLFLQAKEVEGRAPKTISYYESTIFHLLKTTNVSLCQITANDLRKYLNDYQLLRNAGRVTIDNIRRVFSSFFGWLEDEDYIAKSPVRRIHKVKAPEVVKDVIGDEHMEQLRDGCENARDLAIVDLLASTGIRVGELVRLNKADINLAERECVVKGKGANREKHTSTREPSSISRLISRPEMTAILLCLSVRMHLTIALAVVV